MPNDPNRTDRHNLDAPENATDAGNPDSPSTVEVTGAQHAAAPSTHDATRAYTLEADASSPEVGYSSGSAKLPEIPGYVVTGEIARGGMGRVLAARDLTLDREVAIKVLLATSSKEDLAARFVTESKVTARLPHPGIPPVYALGELEAGPFLAMKLVRGRTLAALLHERESPSHDLARWVGVFEQVCQAVGFAHSQGILHRDLKPANVMVGAFGEVHVMDWGLAKETQLDEEPLASEETSAPTVPEHPHSPPDMTAPGQVMGTPQYMAPEQARAEVVDARADVFSLGAILSVILTGRPAFTGATTIEVLGKATAGNVSEALERLASCGADAELVELALGCLAPDRADRLADGHALADAVGAYGAGVEARLREAQAERAASEARASEQRKRRRVWAVAAVAVIGVLVSGASVAGWQWLRAEEALKQVTTEQRNTQAALDDLTASRDRNLRNLRRVTKELVPDLVGRKRKLTESDRSFIGGLVPMWQEVATARGDSPDAHRLRAEGRFSVATLQENLGQYAAAARAYRSALAAYEDLSRILPADPKSRQAVARAHNNLSTVLESLGRRAEALEQMRAALAIQEQLTRDFPNEPRYQQDLAKSHVNIGNQLGSQGNDKRALGEYRSAQTILNRLRKDYPDENAYRADLAASHANLGNLFHRLGKVPETLEKYRAAVTLYEELADRNADELDLQKNYASIRTNLGAVLFEAGELAEAEAQYRQALEVREGLTSEFPAITEYRSELTRTHNNLAVLLAAARKPAEAEKHHTRALELLSELLEQSPGATEYRDLLASTHDNLGLVLGDTTRGDRRPAEAEEHHRTALVVWDKLRAEFPDSIAYRGNLADCRNHLGLLLSNMGRHEEAEAEYRQALADREELAAKFPNKIEYQLSLAGGCCNFGRLVVSRGELGEGLKWFNKAITLLKPRVASESRDMKARKFLRNSFWGRAEVYDKSDQTAAATADWDEAMKLSPPREQIILRGRRADSRARAGLAEESVANIDAIASLIEWPPGNRYNFACVYAIASAKVNDANRKQQYADKAMDMLRKAVQAGWTNAEHIATDPDLAPLRDRDDFKQLIANIKS